MKKLLTVILVLALMVSTAFAENVDLASMPVDELVALKAAIVGELMSRGEIKQATIPGGMYIIGKDIPAGAYSITTDQLIAMLTISDADGNYLNLFSLSDGDSLGKIVFEDGQQIQLTATCIFSIYSGISFE